MDVSVFCQCCNMKARAEGRGGQGSRSWAFLAREDAVGHVLSGGREDGSWAVPESAGNAGIRRGANCGADTSSPCSHRRSRFAMPLSFGRRHDVSREAGCRVRPYPRMRRETVRLKDGGRSFQRPADPEFFGVLGHSVSGRVDVALRDEALFRYDAEALCGSVATEAGSETSRWLQRQYPPCDILPRRRGQKGSGASACLRGIAVKSAHCSDPCEASDPACRTAWGVSSELISTNSLKGSSLMYQGNEDKGNAPQWPKTPDGTAGVPWGRKRRCQRALSGRGRRSRSPIASQA